MSGTDREDDSDPAAKGGGRRYAPRTSWTPTTALVFTSHGRWGPYLVDSVSAGCARMSGDAAPRAGEHVKVQFQLPDGRNLWVWGDVLRREARAGASVSFTLGFHEAPPDLLATLQRAELPREDERGRLPVDVLVVDGSSAAGQALAEDLAALGLGAAVAASASEARRMLRKAGRDLRAVMIDLRVAMEEGVELLARLVEERPGVRRIVLAAQTHLSEPELAHTVMSAADAVLEKPWDRERLGEVLSDLRGKE